jgi:hypothetical protein
MEAVRPSLAEHKLLINSAEILFIQRKFELHRGSRGGGGHGVSTFCFANFGASYFTIWSIIYLNLKRTFYVVYSIMLHYFGECSVMMHLI